ncbi:MAG TPA: molybdenum cofactor biosynthesis protein MoaE [Gammaproteobacteria bacterium]|nr:molybdenum cofactor biosynthesis protein MoaE [Gammaproteobacteria bacterium]
MAERILTEPLNLDVLLAATQSPDAGALSVFAGTVRRHNDGREVAALEYSVYEPLAERRLAEIEREAEQRFGVTCCRIQHRVGQLEIGDTSVLVVVRSPHRSEAFAAARYAIDTVKHTVPIWKRESYADGTQSYVKGCALHEEEATENA